MHAQTFTRVAGGLASLCVGALLLAGAASAGVSEPGLVVRINGTPTVECAGKTQPLSEGAKVHVGDVVVTDASAKLKVLLADDSVLAIGPRSRVLLDEFALGDDRRVRLNVLAGRFKIAVAKFFGRNSDYQVRTPTAVAGVRGTVLWGDTDLDTICALDGQVEVRPTVGQSVVSVTAGRCLSQLASGTVVPLQPSAAEMAEYLKQVTLD